MAFFFCSRKVNAEGKAIIDVLAGMFHVRVANGKEYIALNSGTSCYVALMYIVNILKFKVRPAMFILAYFSLKIYF